jgi:hypothetical protein
MGDFEDRQIRIGKKKIHKWDKIIAKMKQKYNILVIFQA